MFAGGNTVPSNGYVPCRSITDNLGTLISDDRNPQGSQLTTSPPLHEHAAIPLYAAMQDEPSLYVGVYSGGLKPGAWAHGSAMAEPVMAAHMTRRVEVFMVKKIRGTRC